MKRSASSGFTLIECMISVAVAALLFLTTLGLLSYARVNNQFEQERARAHQIVSERLEVERYRLFTWTVSQSQQTVWDNNTPDDSTDDTVGTLEVVVKDPKTGAVLTMAPDPATLVEIETTLTWNPRGKFSSRTMRETAMTYKAP